VVFVDEPFGALDETNTRNLSNHLHALIRGAFGFEQGFLVAHDSSIMGAMPARLVVTSNGVSSKLEAV
jgi:DNA repair exonuclease SbcCD ATPase subunit